MVGNKIFEENLLLSNVILRASKGFDRELEDGEASRRHTLNPTLKLNAEDNLAYAA